MRISTLKHRVDSILARRMIRESEEFFGPTTRNPAWEWRYCDLCGSWYNWLMEPWSDQGATKKVCSPRCKETIALIARTSGQKDRAREDPEAHKARRREGEKKAPPATLSARCARSKAADGAMYRRLHVLARWFGERWFTRAEAARALKIGNGKSIHAHLARMESHELLERKNDEGRGTKSWYRLTDHPESRKALDWARTKGETR